MEQPSWEPASYVAGMFDGEGHVEHAGPQSKRPGQGRRYVFTNTDPDLIAAYCLALDELGIEYRTRVRRPNAQGGQRGTEVVVQRKAARLRFAALVPIQATRKRERMTFAA